MNLLKQIQLPNGRRTSNLGFGCSGLLRVYTRRGREYLLKTAVEEGIAHFDVARMYGLGTAEGIVGSSLKSLRDQITIATKFGLPYETPKGISLHLQSMARFVMNLSPVIKKIARKAAPRPVLPASSPAGGRNYLVDEMEQSLRMSLRQLRTERIDLFFIHEPGMNDLIPESLGNALRQRKAAGEIGSFGVSCQRAELDCFLKTRPDICGEVVQYDYSVFKSGAASVPVTHPCPGMFGVLSSGLQPLDTYLRENRDFTKSWSQQLNLDLTSHDNVGTVILALALVLNPQGFVLFFTSKPRRIRHIMRQLRENSFTEADLRAFRDAILLGIHAN